MSNVGVWVDAESGVKRKVLEVGKSMMIMEVHFVEGAESVEHYHSLMSK